MTINVVLDIDGTLISQPAVYTARYTIHDVVARPYLKEFLQTCFEICDKVSIWTAADNLWCKDVMDHILDPILKELGKEFHIKYTQKNCQVDKKLTSADGRPHHYKPLKRIWKKHPVYTQHNTLIIDNNPNTYKFNRSNAVAIDTFYGDPADKVLLDVCKLLKQHRDHFTEHKTIHSYLRHGMAIIHITGYRGCGKNTLLRYIRSRYGMMASLDIDQLLYEITNYEYNSLENNLAIVQKKMDSFILKCRKRSVNTVVLVGTGVPENDKGLYPQINVLSNDIRCNLWLDTPLETSMYNAINKTIENVFYNVNKFIASSKTQSSDKIDSYLHQLMNFQFGLVASKWLEEYFSTYKKVDKNEIYKTIEFYMLYPASHSLSFIETD